MSARYDDDYILSVQNVTKRYGDLTAVDDVSLDIVPGEIFALLGPNGAGKTTLIGCITGMITRFGGDITVAGYDVRDDYRITRRLVGLVPQELNYDSFFNVREVLKYQGGYFGKRVDYERIDELLEQFSLADKVDQNTRWLSGGMKRRLMICKALMHEPVLLFLDEPTAGVDVELREELWDYVRQLRDGGTTIVLTTHYIEEAEELADRVGIISHGRLLRVAPREQLMSEFGTRRVDVCLTEEVPRGFVESLGELDVEQVEADRLAVVVEEREVHAPGASPVEKLLRAVLDAGLGIDYVEGGRTSLEEIFREVVNADADAEAELVGADKELVGADKEEA
ncbi:MAG: ABC transporter ATP-binding protein [Persicimonas sp.]